MRAPFGVSVPKDGNEDSDRRTLDLEDDTPALADLIKGIDEAVIKTASARAVEFFGKKIPEAQVRAMHAPLLIVPKDSEYKPCVRTKFKLVSPSSRHPTNVYVVLRPGEYRRGSEDDIRPGARVMATVSWPQTTSGRKRRSSRATRRGR